MKQFFSFILLWTLFSGHFFAADSSKNLPPEEDLTPKDREHWSFLPIANPPVPNVQNKNWPLNPVDCFVLSAMETKNLSPSPIADKVSLLRRVYLDLTGLPPTPRQAADFMADTSSDAYEKLVEKLLASPNHGEKWAQHWLDVARYAESNGYEADGERPQAWRYRDYVIRSLNEDKPYFQFVLEQVAGDLLAKGSLSQNEDPVQAIQKNPKIAELLNASGFNRCGPVHMVGGNLDKETLRQETLTEMTTAIGNAFLGLTIGCARCHDHKSDPLSQVDYYRIQAFFGGAQFKEHDLLPGAEKKKKDDEMANWRKQQASIKSAVEAIDKPIRAKITKDKVDMLDPESKQAWLTDPKVRTPEQIKLVMTAQGFVKVTWDEVVAALPPAQKKEREKLKAKLHELDARKPLPTDQSFSIADMATPTTNFMKRGNPKNKGPEIVPGYPRVLIKSSSEFTSSNMNRIDLARWLIRQDHPLTARVMVNRIWLNHFGTGIVSTPNDFGIKGARPTHPELLDWLATEFINSGWSIKHMHRLIVNSQTYRQASKNEDASNLAKDPGNQFLWRMNRRRLEAESLRDNMLVSSGIMNNYLFGPMVRTPLEQEVYDLIFTEGEPDGLWTVHPDPREHHRRSIYLFNKRNVRLPVLEVFDQPDTLSSCPTRNSSTHAPQALTLMNGPVSQELSLAMARQVILIAGNSNEERIKNLWQMAYSRPPSDEEISDAISFLRDQSSLIEKDPAAVKFLRKPLVAKHLQGTGAQDAALVDLCLALLNSSEMVYRP